MKRLLAYPSAALLSVFAAVSHASDLHEVLATPFADSARVFAAEQVTKDRARMPMQMVMAQIEASTGGRVVGAKQVFDRSGLPAYEVKVLMPNGVVRVLRVDPDTGIPR